MLNKVHAVTLILFCVGLASCDLFSDTTSSDPSDLHLDSEIWNEFYQAEVEAPEKEELSDKFREDALRLALRLALDSDDSYDEVYPPTDIADAIENAILLIYNNPELEGWEEVFKEHQISPLPNPNMYEMNVGVEDTTGWAQPWFEGERLTGKEEVDQLMLEFEFEVKQTLQNLRSVTLKADLPLNLMQVGSLFEDVDGIRYAEPNSALGDGDDIQIWADRDILHFEFSHGWGDCPSGCINRKTWEYRVSPQGDVEFVR